MKFLILLIIWTALAAGDDQCFSTICPVKSWFRTENFDDLGEIVGVDVDKNYNVVILHRGDRQWNQNTMDDDFNYIGEDRPIGQNTLVTLNPSNAQRSHEWGSGLFFMPHSVTVDKSNQVWVTDVALNQVFKFPPNGGDLKLPSMTVGYANGDQAIDNNDADGFCGPTDVAVSNDGKSFFVSDGYCNSRIVKYHVEQNEQGQDEAVRDWQVGARGPGIQGETAWNVPHSLALIESLNLICVADRENGRIVCIDTETQQPVQTMEPLQYMPSLYSIDYAYAHDQHLLYAVTGPPRGPLGIGYAEGLVFDVASGDLLDNFFALGDGLVSPHAVAAASDGVEVFVAEATQPYRVYKFRDQRLVRTAGAGGVRATGVLVLAAAAFGATRV